MDRREILELLCFEPLQTLLEMADKARSRHKGAHVHLRGLIEFSNICRRNCFYCGLRAQNRTLKRYMLDLEGIMNAARLAVADGADTIVLQSGEGACDRAWLGDVIREIVNGLHVPVTISVGECSEKDYEFWRNAGASRYLLRHETASPDLYARFHPGYSLEKRINCLKALKHLGYETGGGFIAGLPGQTIAMLADDICLCQKLELDMVGIGPFIPQKATPLWRGKGAPLELGLRALAVMRIVVPGANMPATTALATLDPLRGQILGLKAGANVLMPCYTPRLRATAYAIYDGKQSVTMARACADIMASGRTCAVGNAQKAACSE